MPAAGGSPRSNRSSMKASRVSGPTSASPKRTTAAIFFTAAIAKPKSTTCTICCGTSRSPKVSPRIIRTPALHHQSLGFRRRPALRRGSLDQRHTGKLADICRSLECTLQLRLLRDELFRQRHRRVYRHAQRRTLHPLVPIRRVLSPFPCAWPGPEARCPVSIQPPSAGTLPHRDEIAVSIAPLHLYGRAGDIRHRDADVPPAAAGVSERYERRPQRNAIHVRPQYHGRARHNRGHDLALRLSPRRIVDRPVERTIRVGTRDDQIGRRR